MPAGTCPEDPSGRPSKTRRKGRLGMMRNTVGIVCACLMLLATGARAELTWETGSLPGGTSDWSSLALDADGRPHVAYYASGGDLKYAYWDGDDWVVETLDSEGDVGNYASLAVGSDGLPRISYYDATNGQLRYYNGTSVEAISTAGDAGQYTSLALDAAGNPHIAFQVTGSSSLWYAAQDDSDWHVQNVETGTTLGLWTSDGDSWAIETVDTGGTGLGTYTSLALDRQGYPHISYFDPARVRLKYASWNGTGWTIDTPDTRGFEGGLYTSLALAGGTSPTISYWSYRYPIPEGVGQLADGSVESVLTLARWNGTSWEIQDIASFPLSGDLQAPTSLALDENGFVHISYTDPSSGNVGYALGTPEPATCALALVSLAVAGGYVRRRRGTATDPGD